MSILFHVPTQIEELSLDDDFTGTNYDSWNQTKWTFLDEDGTNEIQNNKGRSSISGGGSQERNIAVNNFILPAGEFDIQVDWEIISNNPNGDYWVVSMFIFAQSGTATSPYDEFYFAMSRLYSSGAHKIRSTRHDGNPIQDASNEFVNTATSGKFRITRDALHQPHGFYDVGGGWVEPWDTWWGTTATFQVQLRVTNGSGNAAVTADWDNLISV
ncbi:MAG: hypothetical protein DRI98_08055 [Bacteroidetes bacterium]|nr:MAG: hypothetical protein DRI98_08055 [Bacteroidota bacterium]